MLKLRGLGVKTLICKCFLLLFMFNSCKSEQDLIQNKLIGSWDITEINYKDNDYVETLLINAFTIEKDGTITIPDTIDSKFDDREIISKWILKNQKELVINCKKNNVFNDSFKIIFFKDYEKKLLGIELKSDNTYISAFKVLQNFDVDGKNWDTIR